MRVLFSPTTNLAAAVAEAVWAAKQSVFVATYVPPNPDLCTVLALVARARGVRVRVVVDVGPTQHNPVDTLAGNVDVRVVQPVAGTMHHKFVIIDDTQVLTGSFNLSSNRNSHNALLVLDDADVVAQFSAEAEHLWSLPIGEALLQPYQADVLWNAAVGALGKSNSFLDKVRERYQGRGWLTANEERSLRNTIRKWGKDEPVIPTSQPTADADLGW